MLQEKISADLKGAMKAGKSFDVGVLRMLVSALNNKRIEKRGKGFMDTLSNEEVIEVVRKEAKKRKEAIEAYLAGQREDLMAQEQRELVFLQQYLPAALSSAEVERVIDSVLAANPGVTHKEFGKLMGEAMKHLRGKADASTISEILKKKLGNPSMSSGYIPNPQ